MRSTIKKNYIFNTSYQIFTLLVPLIVTPYISRVLGAGNIGIYSYTYSVVSYFMLVAALGTGTYGIRSIGMCNSKEEKSRIFYNIVIFRFVMTFLCLLIYFVYWFTIANMNFIVLIQSLYIIGIFFDITWFFQGIEDFKKVAIRNFLFKIITVLCIFVFVKDANDLPNYIICLSGFILLGNLSMWVYLPKYLCKISFRSLSPFKDFKSILLLFFPTIAVQIYSLIDKTLIGLLVQGETTEYVSIIVDGVSQIVEKITPISNLENGYYEQSEKIIKMALMVIISLSTVMIPKISSAFKNKELENAKRLIKKSFHFVFMLAIPMALGIIGIANDLVPLFFGEGYERVKIILPICSVLFIFMGVNSIIGNQYLISSGQQGKYTFILLIGGIVNIVLDVLLIPNFLGTGAALASVLGEMVISIIGIIIMIKNKILSFKEIINSIWKYVFSGIIMLLFIILLNYLFTSSNLFILILIIGLAILIYFSTLLVLKDKFLLENINPLKNKILNKIKKIAK